MAIRIVHVSELTKRPVRVPKPKKDTVSAKRIARPAYKFDRGENGRDYERGN